jgi:hypothetical protein
MAHSISWPSGILDNQGKHSIKRKELMKQNENSDF